MIICSKTKVNFDATLVNLKQQKVEGGGVMGDQSPCDSCKVLEPVLDIHCCFQGSGVFFHHFGRLNSGKKATGHINTTFLQQALTVPGSHCPSLTPGGGEGKPFSPQRT